MLAKHTPLQWIALLAACGFASCAQAAPPETRLSDEDVPVLRDAKRIEVLRGLEHPWAMVWLDSKRMLVSERAGRLRLIEDGKLIKQPIKGLPKILQHGQGGLLDLSLHPQYHQSSKQNWLYFTYAIGSEDSNATRLARAKLQNNQLSAVETLYEASPRKSGGQHFGSRIAWLADGTLLLSIGDGGNPPSEIDGTLTRDMAQDRNKPFGKVIRLNDDGSVPTDNPFVSAQNPADETHSAKIYSYGHRNIQGLAVDSKSNTVYASEHGALGGDELNILKPGANYGWPIVSYAKDYVSGEQVGIGKTDPRFVAPSLVWKQAIAPSGLMVYRGAMFPQWQGKIFAGGLVKQEVRVITLDDRGKVTDEKGLRFGGRVRDVRTAPDGAIYVLTDESNGRLFRLEALPAPDENPSITVAPK